MIPLYRDIPIRTNDDHYELIAATHNGVPVDLTGCTAAMQIRRFAASTTVLLTVPITFVDRIKGQFAIKITRAQALMLYNAVADTIERGNGARCVYDLCITYSDGVRECLIEGVLAIKLGITA